jgi:hypothetical protein
MTEKDFPELPTVKKDAPSQLQKNQQNVPGTSQRQQQLNDINIKLQQLSATTPPVIGDSDQQRPLGARNKKVNRNNSRGSSKNSSRRASRERTSTKLPPQQQPGEQGDDISAPLPELLQRTVLQQQ